MKMPEHFDPPDNEGATREELRRRATGLLRSNLFLQACNDCLCNTRLPAPDVKGVMCDRQIRRPQLEAIRKLVEEKWTGVCAVRFGYDQTSGKLCCIIHIDPFSRELQRAHWPFADSIEEIIGTEERTSFFFLPKMDMVGYSSEIEIFPRPAAPDAPEPNPA